MTEAQKSIDDIYIEIKKDLAESILMVIEETNKIQTDLNNLGGMIIDYYEQGGTGEL